MLVSMDSILKNAREGGYGIAAPNVFNADTVLASFQVADELKAPLLIDCAYIFDLEFLAKATRFFSRRFPNVTAALNVDHCKTFDVAVRALRAGFTSIMVDGSQLPFEENIRLTTEVVKMAHAAGVSVEAELGHVGMGIDYNVDRDAWLTDVDEAVEFVKRTSVDSLAVAIGTVHGRYIGTPKLDFERLIRLRSNVPATLVVHGGSSTGDENLKKLVNLGITKINIDTDLRSSGARYVKEYLIEKEHPDLLYIDKAGIEGYKNMLKHYMILLNMTNRT